MLKKRIIPCLDVKNSRVVKGINFVNLKDAGDPAEQAFYYSQSGADEITFLDITATSDNRDSMYDVIEMTAKKCFVPLTVGGGVRSTDDMDKFLRIGADKVSINSSAIMDPNLINKGAEKFGKQCIVVAIDARFNLERKSWDVYTHGGRKNSGLDVYDWAQEAESRGAGEILLTSMDKDGTKNGFDIPLINKISNNLNIPVIASGGVGTLKHFEEGILEGCASAVLAASIFHFGEHTITEAKKYLHSKGIPVRLDYE